jgi:hypothetical protein
MKSSNYFIIDALGAFIDPENAPLNWSKLPFYIYEQPGVLRKASRRIISNFRRFALKVASIGYNAVSIDDLAHMALLDCYGKKTKNVILQFQRLYKRIIQIANDMGLAVFVNFDIAYFNKDIDKFLKYKKNSLLYKNNSVLDILKEALSYLFNNFAVAGIITRIGEVDGIDVKGIFRSRITIRSVSGAKKYLCGLLPICELNDKIWIFRTWSIGGTSIGDLMWNEKRFTKIFGKVHSNNLIISMKYGVSDFFRNMELNPLFMIKGQKKIIELQTRREYDFFGELPYYTGFEYEKYYCQLKSNTELVGIHVWCQTGGWTKSNKITFLHDSSPYVELNTISSINIFKGKKSQDEITRYFNNTKMTLFLRKYNDLSNKILYPKDTMPRYFNKIYVPSTLWAHWGNISITNFTSSFVKYYYNDIFISDDEFEDILLIGKDCGLKTKELLFYIATLKILYYVRRSLYNRITRKDISVRIKEYSEKYNLLSFKVSGKGHSNLMKLLFHIMIRKKQNYRIIDFFLMSRPVIILLYLYISRSKSSKPEFINKQAMYLLDVFG